MHKLYKYTFLFLSIMSLSGCMMARQESVINPPQEQDTLTRSAPRSGEQLTEEIIQKCKSPRWKIYDNDPNAKNYYYLADITKEEIECKEKEFFKTLDTVLPNPQDREECIQSFHEHKTAFLKMSGIIAQKNNICAESNLGCGAYGEVPNILLYNDLLNKLISYTLKRQDWVYE